MIDICGVMISWKRGTVNGPISQGQVYTGRDTFLWFNINESKEWFRVNTNTLYFIIQDLQACKNATEVMLYFESIKIK